MSLFIHLKKYKKLYIHRIKSALIAAITFPLPTLIAWTTFSYYQLQNNKLSENQYYSQQVAIVFACLIIFKLLYDAKSGGI